MDKCSICGISIQDSGGFTSVYSHKPFVDGKNYSLICWTCCNVPKTWETINGEMVIYSYLSPDRLCSVGEMMEDGWDRTTAELSIKSVKKLLKSRKFIVKYDEIILDTIIINISIKSI